MPIFEYHCSSCQETFEQLVLSRRDTDVRCPKCGRTKVRQLVSRFAARASSSGDCYNRAAGLCQAGGGSMV